MRQFYSARDSPLLRGSKAIHSFSCWLESPMALSFTLIPGQSHPSGSHPRPIPSLRFPYLRPFSCSHLSLMGQSGQAHTRVHTHTHNMYIDLLFPQHTTTSESVNFILPRLLLMQEAGKKQANQLFLASVSVFQPHNSCQHQFVRLRTN